MPVVMITAPPLPSPDAQHDALVAVNRAVAAGLQLQPSDVYSTFTAAGTAALGERPVTAWPVVLVHGSARPRELTDAAITLIRMEICARWACPDDAVWVQWVVPA